MDESLKALQLIHRSLLAISAALLVFAVSANRKPGPYQAALVEFNTLKTLMPQVEQSRVDEESNVYSGSQLGTIVRLEASRQHVSAEHAEYVGAIEENALQFSPPIYLANSSHPIDGFYKYIQTAPGFDSFPLYSFDDSELRGALAELLRHSGGIPISKVYFGLYVDTKGPKFKQIPGKCSLSIPIPDSTGENRSYDTNPIRCHLEKTIHYHLAVGMLKNAKLFEERDGYILPLPALSLIWDDIAGKEMTTVQGILERKAAVEKSSQEGTLSVVGLSLSARATGLAGPTLELLILFYLLAHLRHIHSLKMTEPDKIKSFPDVGISSGVLGTILVSCTVVVFPLVAGNTIILQSFLEAKIRILLVSIFSAGCLTISIWSVVLLKKLRN